MLYQTHHPFLFPLNPFTTPILSLSTTTTTTPPPLPPPSIQAMDCVEGALKSSFGPDPSKRAPNQPFADDSSAINGQSCVSGDDSFVDDLLDFSEGDSVDGFCEIVKEETGEGFCEAVKEEILVEKEEENKEGTEENKKDSNHCRNNTDNFSVIDDFPSVPCGELSLPTDDLADLEWLSNFVDDDSSTYSLQYAAGKSPEKPKPVPVSRRSGPAGSPFQTKNPCFKSPVQTKARSKRSRTGFRLWSLDSMISLTDSSSTSSSSSSTAQTADSVLKNQRRKKTVAGGGGVAQPRRCSHCLVQKTPQWRAGPLGAKTLCNACGVRFKSGRLLPEYRPACSPTFLSDVHSNNHRKVLEMRRKKEGEGGGTVALPTVQSF